MSEQQTMRVQLYAPHAGQRRLHESTKRFRVMACGRRWGKTLACCNEISRHVLEHNNTLALWVAPTYRASTIAFRMMSKALKEVLAAPPNKSELRLELINGSEINFASAERYDNMRGIGVHFLVMDEVGQIAEEAWTEVLRPTLSDTNGRAVFIGSPRGRNWFYYLFQRGLDPEEVDWESFSFPTASNPYIPPGEIEAARRDMPVDKFAQEYEAVFLEDAAAVFHNVDNCVYGDICDPEPDAPYVVGYDPAKYEDFSVVTVLNMRTHHVDYWERFQHIDWDQQLEIVAMIARRYNYALIEMDATGIGDPLMEQIKKKDVIVTGTKFDNVKKEQRVRNLSLLLEHGDITFPEIKVLIKELKDFEYHYTESRNLVYGAPHGKHDDAVTSLMLAAWRIQDSEDIPYAATTSLATDGSIPLPTKVDDKRLEERQEHVANSLRFIQNTDIFTGM